MDFLEKLKKLPPNIKSFFDSNEPMIEIEKIGFAYGINENNFKNISKSIGPIFVKDLGLNDLPNILSKNLNSNKTGTIFGIAHEVNKKFFNRFPEYFQDSQTLLEQWSKLKSAPLISEDEAYRKVLELEPWILEVEKEKRAEETQKQKESKQFQESLVSILLSEALRIYPEVGEQLITSSKISLRSFPYPVRPSIKNWLADYTFILGYEKHESMARSRYLFQEANAKKLPAPERQKLAYLLKSFDENLPITVNKRTQQVIFPTINPPSRSTHNTASTSSLDNFANNNKHTSLINKPAREIEPPQNLANQFRPTVNPREEQKNINALQFSYRQQFPYEKKLAAPTPVKNLPREIPPQSQRVEPPSPSGDPKASFENQGAGQFFRGEPGEFYGRENISQDNPEKTTTAPAPKSNQPQPRPIKPDFWNVNPAPASPAPKSPAPISPKPVKNLSQSPWRLPGKPSTPPSQPKNIVDLKNIQN
jgi:hypothetical protein